METIAIIAENVRRGRQARSLSQEQFAEIAGLHRTYIGAVERGERNLTVNILDKLAIALRCSVADLVSRS